MPVRVVRLGTPRLPGEGTRIGTVRRPPRGVPRNRYAADDWFDVWLPALAPSAALLTAARTWDAGAWARRFPARYRAEMARPDSGRLLDLLAALSHDTNFSVGCYCDDERRCHRGILRRLLEARGAAVER